MPEAGAHQERYLKFLVIDNEIFFVEGRFKRKHQSQSI